MNLNITDLIEQLKLSGVQEVSFTIKFADNNPIPKAVKPKNKATLSAKNIPFFKFLPYP